MRSYLDADYVYVLDGGEKLERAVEVGLMTASQAEILRGLDAGEQVIVRDAYGRRRQVLGMDANTMEHLRCLRHVGR